jgi:hypothetical protein
MTITYFLNPPQLLIILIILDLLISPGIDVILLFSPALSILTNVLHFRHQQSQLCIIKILDFILIIFVVDVNIGKRKFILSYCLQHLVPHTHKIRRQRIWPHIFNHMIGSTTDTTLQSKF